MGLFVAMAAVRDVAVRDVATAVEAWCSDRFVVCSDATGSDVESSNRIDVMEPVDGWTVVALPGYFIPYEEIATHLSAELGAVASAVAVSDSDCWQQVSLDSGRIVDRFATDARYLVSDLEPLSVVAPRWEGDPQAVATLLGCDARDVARHYKRNRRSRTFDDWGFVALWATEGITYPEPSATIGVTLALGDDWASVLHRVMRR
ncbi:MAG: hypothetical protein ABIR39_14235 [Nocardioides sp.]|uniref:hypothetical protein n=1 Tax=Nocardioides sp. TaxID=35761 RepID=UPI003263928A